MPAIINRPPPALCPGPGLLLKDQFQIAYVTNDMERARALMASRYGIREFCLLEGPMPSGGLMKVAFAWVGSTLYELIDATGPATDFYTRCLPSGDFAIRFHHLGFLVHDRDHWLALERELEDGDWPIVYRSLSGSFMDAYYVDAPELGHYLEYIYPYADGAAFLAAVPHNQ